LYGIVFFDLTFLQNHARWYIFIAASPIYATTPLFLTIRGLPPLLLCPKGRYAFHVVQLHAHTRQKVPGNCTDIAALYGVIRNIYLFGALERNSQVPVNAHHDQYQYQGEGFWDTEPQLKGDYRQ